MNKQQLDEITNQLLLCNKDNNYKIIYKLEKHVVTHDFMWCPPYQDNTVKVVFFIATYKNKFCIRLLAHGADDTMVAKEKMSEDVYVVLNICDKYLKFYNNIPDNVSVNYFLKNGFKYD